MRRSPVNAQMGLPGQCQMWTSEESARISERTREPFAASGQVLAVCIQPTVQASYLKHVASYRVNRAAVVGAAGGHRPAVHSGRCSGTGLPSCWFRCTVPKQRQPCRRVQRSAGGQSVAVGQAALGLRHGRAVPAGGVASGALYGVRFMAFSFMPCMGRV